jgi:hypothetical protein
MRKVPGIEMIHAQRASGPGQRVAIVVEDAEGIAVLENKRPQVLERNRSCDDKRLVLLGFRGLIGTARSGDRILVAFA